MGLLGPIARLGLMDMDIRLYAAMDRAGVRDEVRALNAGTAAGPPVPGRSRPVDAGDILGSSI